MPTLASWQLPRGVQRPFCQHFSRPLGHSFTALLIPTNGPSGTGAGKGTVWPTTARTMGNVGCHGAHTWFSEVLGERVSAATAALTASSPKPCGWEEGDRSVDLSPRRGHLPGSGTHLHHRPILTSFLGCCRHSPHLTGNSQKNSTFSRSGELGCTKISPDRSVWNESSAQPWHTQGLTVKARRE